METIGLILFLLQQLGMTLGVGGSVLALISYTAASRDGDVDSAEHSSLRMSYVVLRTGLFFIIVSGILITAAHVLAGESEVVLAPAFVSKWLLIGVIVMNGVLMSLKLMPPAVGVPLAGGTWFALFLLHNLAPETSLPVLGVLYFGWLALFVPLFHGMKTLARKQEGLSPSPAPFSVREVPRTPPVLRTTLPPIPPPSLPRIPSGVKQAYPPAPLEKKHHEITSVTPAGAGHSFTRATPKKPESVPPDDKPISPIVSKLAPITLPKIDVSKPAPAPIPLPRYEQKSILTTPFIPKAAPASTSAVAPSKPAPTPSPAMKPEYKPVPPSAAPSSPAAKKEAALETVPKPAAEIILEQKSEVSLAPALSKVTTHAKGEMTSSKVQAPLPAPGANKPGLFSALRGLFTVEKGPVSLPPRPAPAIAPLSVPSPLAKPTPPPAPQSVVLPPKPAAPVFVPPVRPLTTVLTSSSLPKPPLVPPTKPLVPSQQKPAVEASAVVPLPPEPQLPLSEKSHVQKMADGPGLKNAQLPQLPKESTLSLPKHPTPPLPDSRPLAAVAGVPASIPAPKPIPPGNTPTTPAKPPMTTMMPKTALPDAKPSATPVQKMEPPSNLPTGQGAPGITFKPEQQHPQTPATKQSSPDISFPLK